MRQITTRSASLLCLTALSLSLAPLACSSDSSSGSGETAVENSGSIGLALQIAPGQNVASATYTISGPQGFTKTDTVDVSDSTQLQITIGGLPVGTGFTITLNAVSTDGSITCSGSAAFDVAARQTTPVAVHLVCHEGVRTGSVLVNGALNVCAVLDGVSANPAEVFVGSSLALGAVAHDSDQAPAALSYHWTTTGGTLSDPSSATPTLTCTGPGSITATVSVSDGDPAVGCADSGSATISCSAGSVGAGGATSSGGAGGSGGVGTAGGASAGSAGSGGANAGASGTATGGAGGASAGSGGATSSGGAGGSGGGGTAGGGAGGANAGAGGTATGSAGAGGSGGAPTLGDVVIYRVGDGLSALTSASNPVFLDEYSANGVLVRSTPAPTSVLGANHRLVASGTATSEGFITRSSDGKYLVFTGYDASVGTASVAGTSATATPRVIARLDATGVIDTTTALTDAASGNNPRSAASSDGQSLWFAGAAGGVRFTTLGSASSLQLSTTVANVRQVNIFASQLFVSDSSGSAVRVGAVGTGLPTTAGQAITNLPGISPSTGSPYAYFLADLSDSVPGLDTLYVADDSIGLSKYALVSGSWTLEGTVGAAADAYRGLTAAVSGSTVTLFSTRKGGSAAAGGGELVSLVDASGFAGSLTTAPVLLATALVNTAFRGIAFAPTP